MHDDRHSETEILNAWADDAVRLEAERDEARRERDQFGELLSVALEKLSASTVAQQQQRNRIADLLVQLRQRPTWNEWRRAA